MKRAQIFKGSLWRVGILTLLLSGCAGPADVASELPWQRSYQQQFDEQSIRGTPLGFKAGLTTRETQQKFASDRAVAGVLWTALEVGAPVSLAGFAKPMIELELAFRLREPVTQPLDSIAQLKGLVAEVAPAFELPDLGRLRHTPPSATGIVRDNVAAHSFVVAKSMTIPLEMLDALSVRLWHNGQLVVEAPTSSLLGGPWQTLLELINNRVAYGWTIEPGQWLLSGALGGMHSLEPEEYVGEVLWGGEVVVGRAQLLVDP